MLNSKNTVLVIIDVQGKLARIMQNTDELFKNLAILIKGARLLDVPIIWMEQLPDKLGSTVEEVSVHLDGLKPIAKDVFSCGQNAEFNDVLNDLNPTNVVLSGIETHVCVYQTAMDLLENYNVEIVVDATSTRLAHNKEIALEKIRRTGGQITSVETVLFEIQGKATGDTFKKLIEIIK
ncbi:MAG: isochorismatase family protein [Candidatus Marinimicrobia bacterium]|nr:isochorismatase family protein [Candidatus Neomarinimicrobiota bacterium]